MGRSRSRFLCCSSPVCGFWDWERKCGDVCPKCNGPWWKVDSPKGSRNAGGGRGRHADASLGHGGGDAGAGAGAGKGADRDGQGDRRKYAGCHGGSDGDKPSSAQDLVAGLAAYLQVDTAVLAERLGDVLPAPTEVLQPPSGGTAERKARELEAWTAIGKARSAANKLKALLKKDEKVVNRAEEHLAEAKAARDKTTTDLEKAKADFAAAEAAYRKLQADRAPDDDLDAGADEEAIELLQADMQAAKAQHDKLERRLRAIKGKGKGAFETIVGSSRFDFQSPAPGRHRGVERPSGRAVRQRAASMSPQRRGQFRSRTPPRAAEDENGDGYTSAMDRDPGTGDLHEAGCGPRHS